MKKETKQKISNEKAFMIILIFAIGGFITVMMGILTNPLATNQTQDLEDEEIDIFYLESKAKEIVSSSVHFKEYSDGNLIYEEKQNLNSEDSWSFSYSFKAKNLDESLEHIDSFRYIVTYEKDQLKLVEVSEIIR